ncbi:unnamed protein product [Scytosiphon promiscuus]
MTSTPSLSYLVLHGFCLAVKLPQHALCSDGAHDFDVLPEHLLVVKKPSTGFECTVRSPLIPRDKLMFRDVKSSCPGPSHTSRRGPRSLPPLMNIGGSTTTCAPCIVILNWPHDYELPCSSPFSLGSS